MDNLIFSQRNKEEAMVFEAAVELLKNIESGKYRFLFMALARHFERVAEEHNIDMNPFEGGD